MGNVDFRVMGTFLEFYMTLLQFVNSHLYHNFGIQYPPLFCSNMKEGDPSLASIMSIIGFHIIRESASVFSNSYNQLSINQQKEKNQKTKLIQYHMFKTNSRNENFDINPNSKCKKLISIT